MSRRRDAVLDDWVQDPWDDPVELEPDEFERLRKPAKAWRWFLAFVGLAVAGAAAAVAWGVFTIIGQIDGSLGPGQAGETVSIEVAPGASLQSVADLLQAQGVVPNAAVFRIYAEREGGIALNPGTFDVVKGAAFDDIIRALETKPEETFVKVRFPEGYTVELLAQRLQNELPRMSADRFLAALTSGEVTTCFLETPPTTVQGWEGLLFPDTYQIYGRETEKDVAQRMADLMCRVARKNKIDSSMATVFRSRYEVLIIASMIEREAKVPEDRAKIARVIYNRLTRNMKLDIDATVLYAAEGNQTRVTDELKEATRDSPYNTYFAPGLPPTPIAAPSEASIRAALNPTPITANDGKWLYYVVIDADGRHAFANTLEEHLNNVKLARQFGVL